MGLKNKIKGFVKERMPFIMRCVRGFKGAKNAHESAHDRDAHYGINREIKEMLETKKLYSLQEKAFYGINREIKEMLETKKLYSLQEKALFNHDHQESVFLAIASLNNESFIEYNKSIYKNSSFNYNYGGSI
ncbi:beta-1,4-N-acetylgalactosaminyltransferase [Helicobacter pylori]|uniref:beta-1,4-N-acetylgalactosaminyltransferase n=1 Tax=Helicobacter pylori TaxID=210 RepID=UPI000BEA06BB|nr:beta-1,4-N-acetylgalactosaminyltransferase [Helicobacter pylori]PDW64941.1 beta-1,4-N-acetylgalactosaminyltransferase [Helicobacter pylori]